MTQSAVSVSSEVPALRQPTRRLLWPVAAWLFTFAAIVIYGWCYARLIQQSSVIPTHDQAAYIKKTYALADALYYTPWRLLHPATLFGSPSANRPPLMMFLAALIAGPHASPQTIGLIWLTLRLLILAVALWEISRLAGTLRLLPAAALAILAAPGGLTLHPNMYMMDEPFAAFALLAFTWLVADWRAMAPATARRAGSGALLLFLIKPAALVLILPLYTLLLFRFWQLRCDDAGFCWRSTRSWRYIHAFFALLLLLILATPYGWAVAQQYLLGSHGYWDQPRRFIAVIGMLALLAPPWLLAFAGADVAWRGVGPASWPRPEQRKIVLAALLTVGWWYLFNAGITYTLDARVLAGAMPIAVVGGLLVVVRSRIGAVLATFMAAVLFVASLLATTGRLPCPRLANAFSPMPASQQPIEEVGLISLASRLRDTVSAASLDGSLRTHGVMVVTSDEYVELNALQLAMRFTGGDAGLDLDSHPWGSRDINVPATFQRFEWFITKSRFKYPPLTGDVWTSLRAIDALILDPESPWRDKFQKQFTLPICEPGPNGSVLHDSVTFWRLPESPTADDLRAAMTFMAPYFASTPGAAHFAQQRDALP